MDFQVLCISDSKRRGGRQGSNGQENRYLVMRMTGNTMTGHSFNMANQLDLVHRFLAVLALDDLLGRKVYIVLTRGCLCARRSGRGGRLGALSGCGVS